MTRTFGGQDRRLTYSWGAIKRLQAQGINLLDMKNVELLNPTTLSLLVWGGLITETPDLTVEQVDSWMSLKELTELTQWVAQTILSERGVTEDEQRTDPTTPVAPPSTAPA